MGMSAGGQGSDRFRAMSDINVTPMVDIMLVLLIIFMVAAPLMNQGVEVDLPKGSTQPLHSDKEPLVVSVSANGTTYIEDRPFSSADLIAKVQAMKQADSHLVVYVRGDKSATYGMVVGVMDQLQQAGVDQVGLVTELPTNK